MARDDGKRAFSRWSAVVVTDAVVDASDTEPAEEGLCMEVICDDVRDSGDVVVTVSQETSVCEVELLRYVAGGVERWN